MDVAEDNAEGGLLRSSMLGHHSISFMRFFASAPLASFNYSMGVGLMRASADGRRFSDLPSGLLREGFSVGPPSVGEWATLNNDSVDGESRQFWGRSDESFKPAGTRFISWAAPRGMVRGEDLIAQQPIHP